MGHRLHAFRHDADPERAPDLDDRRDQAPLRFRDVDGRDQLPVDLQAVRCKF